MSRRSSRRCTCRPTIPRSWSPTKFIGHAMPDERAQALIAEGHAVKRGRPGTVAARRREPAAARDPRARDHSAARRCGHGGRRLRRRRHARLSRRDSRVGGGRCGRGQGPRRGGARARPRCRAPRSSSPTSTRCTSIAGRRRSGALARLTPDEAEAPRSRQVRLARGAWGRRCGPRSISRGEPAAAPSSPS